MEVPVTQFWTIYYRQPDPYVAVRRCDEAEGDRLMVSSDLAELRVRMCRLGLHCIPRNFFDHEDIVEVWLQ